MCFQECISTASITDIIDGKYEIVIAHPEALFSTNTGKTLREDESFCGRVVTVVVDECHTIEQWKKDFRPAFDKIRTLPSYFKCPIIALSATLTVDMWSRLPSQLGIGKRNFKSFKQNPDKSTMFYELRSKPSNMDINECAETVYLKELEALEEQGEDYPVTLCYMPLRWCSWALSEARYMEKLPQDLEDARHTLIFSLQNEEVVEYVTSDLKKDKPQYRLIFCSSALGMGFDSPSITRVIHGKPPRNMPDFVQQVGRAGRSGQECESIVYFNNNDLGQNVKGMTNNMREYCKTDKCLRLCILGTFGFTEPLKAIPSCRCCSNCKVKCRCEKCMDTLHEQKSAADQPSTDDSDDDWDIFASP